MGLAGETTSDVRTPQRLRVHYDVEVELADRLRHAPRDARLRLYGEVYDELFARIPDHPQLTRRAEPAERAAHARNQVALIRAFLPDGGNYVEIGAGDCATVQGVAEFAGTSTGVDVSADILPREVPPNVTTAISDGVSVPVPPASADVVYSNQLMEHLHPDDAMEQLRNIAAVLKPGGRYICVTPNRLTGPHDISVLFDDEPRGFHLHEYSYGELGLLLREAGFRRIQVVERAQGRALERLAGVVGRVSATRAESMRAFGDRALTLPIGPYILVERMAALLPVRARRSRLIRRLVGTIRIVAQR